MHAPCSPGCCVLVKLLKWYKYPAHSGISAANSGPLFCQRGAVKILHNYSILHLFQHNFSVLSVPFSASVLFTPFPWMSVSFLKLSGIISAVSGDTGVSILSPPSLASDKHFLPGTSLSSNVPVLSSTRWSNQQTSNRQQPRTPFLWAFLMSQIFRQNSKFHVGLWPLRSVLLREISREKTLPTNHQLLLFSVKKIGSLHSILSWKLWLQGWGARARHGQWRVDDGPGCLMSWWWRLIMADHISGSDLLVWPGSGCSDLSGIMSYETQAPLPGNPFRCPTTCRVIYN